MALWATVVLSLSAILVQCAASSVSYAALLASYAAPVSPLSVCGFPLKFVSNIVTVVSLGLTIFVAHSLRGIFGVVLGVLGMLGTLTMRLTIDVFSPISDNGGDIAEMSQLDEWVRGRTDVLDAAENTNAVIGKGFAIGSVGLVSLALF